MKRIPMMTIFTMAMPSEVSDTGIVNVQGEFFYSMKTDTLYCRDTPKSKWRVNCDGGCRDKTCPVKTPDNYYFKEVKLMYGTKLPTEATR